MTKKKEPKKKKKLKPTAVPSLHLKNPKPIMGRPTKNSKKEDSKEAKQPSTSYIDEHETMEIDYEHESMEDDHDMPDLMEDNDNEDIENAEHFFDALEDIETNDTLVLDHNYQCNEEKRPKRKVKICHLLYSDT